MALSKPFAIPIHLEEGALAPKRAYKDDAAFDLFCYRHGQIAIMQSARERIRTGVRIALPTGVAGLVCPRSGLAARFGVTVLNAPGVIDSGFRGEIEVVLFNSSTVPFMLQPKQAIAQLLLLSINSPKLELTTDVVWREQYADTERAGAGFGSTDGEAA